MDQEVALRDLVVANPEMEAKARLLVLIPELRPDVAVEAELAVEAESTTGQETIIAAPVPEVVVVAAQRKMAVVLCNDASIAAFGT